jgi:tripartite-type tricarboxylate transporter receptor subunit TctC
MFFLKARDNQGGNMRLVRNLVVAAAALSCAAVAASEALAQAYPSRPIKIVTAGAGGASDISSRLIAEGITAALGQPVVVENMAGALAIETVAHAKNDGYTFLYYGNVIWIEPLLRKNAAWDPAKDLTPVIMALRAPNVLTVNPSLPVKSVAELIAYAKAKPNELNYASAGTGSSTHIAGELFKYMAKVDIERIPYKDTGSALVDVLAGRTQVIFASPLSVASYLQSGQLRAIAVTSTQPTPLAPGLPTVASSGVPGYVSESVEGIMAPAGTPPEIVNRIYQEVAKYLNRPEVKERYFKAGAEVVAGTPQQFSETIKAQISALQDVIKSGNLKIE